MSGNSAYEVARRANIERNNVVMAKIGVKSLKSQTNKKSKKSSKSSKRVRTSPIVKTQPTRRSKRTRAEQPTYTGETIDNSMDIPDDLTTDEIRHKKIHKKKMTEAETIAKSQLWLEANKITLQNKYIKVEQGNDQWHQIAIRKWGNHVHLAAAASESKIDWEKYVLSRTSNPSNEIEKFPLLQEEYQHCAWRLLIACVLMSRVSSANTKTIAINGFFRKYPTPSLALDSLLSDPTDAFEILKSLGLFETRFKGVVEVTKAFLSNPIFDCGLDKKVNKIYGIGAFGVDSFNIFIRGDARNMYPDDQNLARYCNWIRSL